MGTATFYQNTSDDRCLDKKLVQKASLSSFEYKDDTTVMNPVIIVANNSNIMQSNYVYLSDFNRYYFIRNITVSQQRLRIDLEVDVLKSFANEIRKQTVIVRRQENKNRCNLYLDDDKFKCYEYSRIQTRDFSYGFDSNAFILTVAGGR